MVFFCCRIIQGSLWSGPLRSLQSGRWAVRQRLRGRHPAPVADGRGEDLWPVEVHPAWYCLTFSFSCPSVTPSHSMMLVIRLRHTENGMCSRCLSQSLLNVSCWESCATHWLRWSFNVVKNWETIINLKKKKKSIYIYKEAINRGLVQQGGYTTSDMWVLPSVILPVKFLDTPVSSLSWWLSTFPHCKYILNNN